MLARAEHSSFVVFSIGDERRKKFYDNDDRKKKKMKRKGLDRLDRQDSEDEQEKDENEKISSHMTCHNIIHQNETSVKLVVYQKLEW
jgi:hypothetical protein